MRTVRGVLSGVPIAIALASMAAVLPASANAAASPADETSQPRANHPSDTETLGAASLSGAVIGNGTVTLGVDRAGNVNYAGVGLRFEETGGDALIPGCWCEGWGIGDADAGVVGWASAANPPSRLRGTVADFTATDDTARSVVVVDEALEVVHDFAPAATPNLYEMTLTVTNLSGEALRPTYRRGMDWDVPPYEFNEFVTIAGEHSALLASTNDGFASLDVRQPPSDLGARGTFEDHGPMDQGALFDFDLGDLAPGDSVRLQMFYGAAASEVRALEAVAAVDGSLWSFGQPPSGAGSADGTPNTFIFTVAELGLRFRPQPASAYVGLPAILKPVGGPDLEPYVGTPFRATVVEGPGAGSTDECPYGRVAWRIGCADLGDVRFRADRPGTSVLHGYLDVDGDGRAGPDEPSTRGTITWLEGIAAVGLGDSFSSGQGAGRYDPDPRVCERSSRAYARVLDAPNGTHIASMARRGVPGASFDFLACGGARSFHVKRGEDGGVAQHPGVPPQLDQGAVRSSTDLVTITIGGNDLGFADVVIFCARKDCADPDEEYKDGLDLESWARARLDALEPELRDLYAELRRSSGDATVVVAGYPYLFPASRSEQNCARLAPFNHREQDLVRALQDVFDARLAALAAEVGVHFVSVLDHFGGHEICGDDHTWMNAIRPAFSWPPVSGASFHPNANGQRQYAHLIRREMRARIGGDPTTTGLPRNPEPGGTSGAGDASSDGSTDGGVSATDAAGSYDGPELSEPARFGVAVRTPDGSDSCGVLVPGDTVAVQLGDLLPGSTASVSLDADGSVLATVTVDDHGQATGTLTLPEGLPEDALLRLDGTSIAGGSALSYALVPVAAERPDCATTPPTITLATPADGASYAVGERVTADYTCEGTELTVCLGDLPVDDPLPAEPGRHRFAVIAQDVFGDETVVEHDYTVGLGLSVRAAEREIPAGAPARFTITRTGPSDDEPLPVAFRIDDGEVRQVLLPAGSDRVVVDRATTIAGQVTIELLETSRYWLEGEATAEVTSTATGTPARPAACDADLVPPSGFTDIGATVHRSAIECILWYRVTRGTTATTYGPELSVTRAQMAALLVRFLETSGVPMPTPTRQPFRDLGSTPHAESIGQLATLGVVRGTTATTYRPHATVRRDQFASMLVRAYELVDGSELARAPAGFTDVPGTTHRAAIEKATAAGFTRGTSATTFSPGSPVRRDQAASFLSRALDRAVADGHVTPPSG
jgi:lysophospholipase L1-like esterase